MEELIAELERKADERAEAILEDAHEKAERIRAEAEREAERLESEHLGEREREWRGEAARRLADVREEGTRTELVARADLLDRIFERAEESLPDAARSETYRETLPERLRAAAAFLEGVAAEAACAPALAEAVREAVEPLEGIRVEPDPTVPPGFLLRAAYDGAVVDATLTDALGRHRPELSIEVLERLRGSSR